MHSFLQIGHEHTASLAALINLEATGSGRGAGAQEMPEEAAIHIAPETLDTLASVISHDLNSPLSAVIGYADLLLEGYTEPLTPSQREYVQTIRENAQRVLTLITLLSDAIKMARGKLIPELQPIEIHQILKQAAREIAEYLEARKQRFCIQEDESVTVLVDLQRMQRVLTLLLRFIAQHIPMGQEIFIDVIPPTADEDMVTIMVRADVSAVSEMGEAVQRRSSTPLQLIIAQAFLKMHGGQLRWTPSERASEIVVIKLPANPELLAAS
ncbi:MAG: HAMP domain-containing histidine kinase [Anaerolineae bacterium]|nr:HAMP domain-containing histidine kinase [Anaerolineae bacterium]